MEIDELVKATVSRELVEETNLIVDEDALEFVGFYDAIDRDPSANRTLTFAYGCFIQEHVQVLAQGGDAAEVRFCYVNLLPPLAFDHFRILSDAYEHFSKSGRISNIDCPPGLLAAG